SGQHELKPLSSGTGSSLAVPPGTSVFVPPYDFAHEGPTHGDGMIVNADPMSGWFRAAAYPPGGFDGACGAAASIGLGLQTTKHGTVSVRPYVEFDWQYWVGGLGLSAASIGHLGFFVAA